MTAADALGSGGGILRLAPNWVPRAFVQPGRRLRLHPDDYYPLGAARGGIAERWLASTVLADNGPLTAPGEGLSQVHDVDGKRLPFDEVVGELGPALLGDRIWTQHHGWPMFAKFFDNAGPLPLHVHHDDRRAALVGKAGKPEAYYYPPQMNGHLGSQPLSFLGLDPRVTRRDVASRLTAFTAAGDNRITELSRAYRSPLATGWDVPTGVLHAPASLCTYEPQGASDVLSIWESWSGGAPVDEALLWRDVPTTHVGDVDFLLDLLDWERNVDPDFAANRAMAPITTAAAAAADAGWTERWIAYRSTAFSATELTVDPGSSVLAVDAAAYGCIVVQGHGRLGGHLAEAPTMLRYGGASNDEFFVAEIGGDGRRGGREPERHRAIGGAQALRAWSPGSARWPAPRCRRSGLSGLGRRSPPLGHVRVPS